MNIFGYIICTYYPFNEGAPCRVWSEVADGPGQFTYGWATLGGEYSRPHIFPTLGGAKLAMDMDKDNDNLGGVWVGDCHIQCLMGAAT